MPSAKLKVKFSSFVLKYLMVSLKISDKNLDKIQINLFEKRWL